MIKLSSEIPGKIVSLFRRAPSVFALITTGFPKIISSWGRLSALLRGNGRQVTGRGSNTFVKGGFAFRKSVNIHL